ncbi:MAG: hypothetical protein R3C44_17200 [Chloroflexota bacterium]
MTAVWVGNTDNEPIGEGQSGTQLAAPIWSQFMTSYLSGQALGFVRPPGIVEREICADRHGTRPQLHPADDRTFCRRSAAVTGQPGLSDDHASGPVDRTEGVGCLFRCGLRRDVCGPAGQRPCDVQERERSGAAMD